MLWVHVSNTLMLHMLSNLWVKDVSQIYHANVLIVPSAHLYLLLPPAFIPSLKRFFDSLLCWLLTESQVDL